MRPIIRRSAKVVGGPEPAISARRQIGHRSQFGPVGPTYLERDALGLDLEVPNITIVYAERTLWDKAVIVHGLRHWHEAKGALRGGGNRISRHYCDLHELVQAPQGQKANAALGADCLDHARMFVNRLAFDLASAKPPTFTLVPEGDIHYALRQDYAAMTAMIFG